MGQSALGSVDNRIRTTPQEDRPIPHRTGFGPDEWFYSVVVVLVGSCPGGE